MDFELNRFLHRLFIVKIECSVKEKGAEKLFPIIVKLTDIRPVH